MAWLERDRPNGPYQLVFRYGDQRLKRSTRTKDERLANELAVRVDRKLRLIEQGDLVVPEDVDIMTFLISDGKLRAKPRPTESVTLQRVRDEYLESLPENALESNSLYTLNIHMRHFLKVIGASFRVRDLKQQTLQGYVNKRSKMEGRRGKPLSPTTIKKELASLSSIWKFAIESGYVTHPFPNRGLKFPKTADKPRFQTWDEIEYQIETCHLSDDEQAELWDCLFLTLPEIDEFLSSIKENARHPFIYPMVVAAAHTGARKSELIRSQRRDIDFRTNVLTLREKKRSRGRLTTRTIPISATLQETMTNWFQQHAGGPQSFCIANPFANDQVPAALTVNQGHSHLQNTLVGKWKNVKGWHVLRHSFASNCAARGVDQRIINAWMGHQTDEMVRRYRHLIPSEHQAAIRMVF
jgi:integrase